MAPSFISLPAKRAVCSMHKPINAMEAFCTSSGISGGICSGNGVTWKRASSGMARRRYCPLALE